MSFRAIARKLLRYASSSSKVRFAYSLCIVNKFSPCGRNDMELGKSTPPQPAQSNASHTDTQQFEQHW